MGNGSAGMKTIIRTATFLIGGLLLAGCAGGTPAAVPSAVSSHPSASSTGTPRPDLAASPQVTTAPHTSAPEAVTAGEAITSPPALETPPVGESEPANDPNATHVYTYQIASDGLALTDVAWFRDGDSPGWRSGDALGQLMPHDGSPWTVTATVRGPIPYGSLVAYVMLDGTQTHSSCTVLVDGIVRVTASSSDPGALAGLSCTLPPAP
jgi:hypothetical protein